MAVERLGFALALVLAGTCPASEPPDPDHRPAYVLDIDGDKKLTLACGLTVPKIKDARGYPHGGLGLRRSHPCEDDRCDALDLWRADQFVAAWRDPGTNVVTLLRLSYPFPYALRSGQLLPADTYFRDARALAAVGYPAVTPEHVQDWLNYYYQRGSTSAVPLQAVATLARMDAVEECVQYDVSVDGRPRLVYVFKLRSEPKAPLPSEFWYVLEIRSERTHGSEEEAFAKAFLQAITFDAVALVAERDFWGKEPFDSFARANAVRGVRNLVDEWKVFHYGNFCLITDNPAAFDCAEEGLESQQRAYDLFGQALFPFGPASLESVCVIRVYATGWEFEDSVSRTRKWAGGMYLPGSDEIVMRGWSRAGTVHEITHRYLRVACGKRGLSVWFNEGFACYLGGCKVSEGRLVPQPVDGGCMLLAMIEQGDLHVVADVFTVEDFYQDKEMERNPKDPVAALKRAKNYAAAWGVIYFLREAPALYPGKGYEALIPLYWETLLRTGDPEKATEAVLGTLSMPRFLSDFSAYFLTFEDDERTREKRRRRPRLVTDDEHGEFLPRERRFDFSSLMFGDGTYENDGEDMGRAALKKKNGDRSPSAGRSARQKGGDDADGKAGHQSGRGSGRAAVAATVLLALGLAFAWGWRRFGGGKLFALALVFSAGDVFGEVAETNGYVVTYRVIGEAAVLGTGEGCAVEPKPEGEFTVPPTLGGHPVVAIGAYAFAECGELTALKLPKTVTEIGECAFHSCQKLKSVPLPASVTEIGAGAFFLCSSLESVTLPPRVRVVPDWAFGRCFRLSELRLSKAVSVIGRDACLGCAALSAVTVPEAVTTVGDRAFKWCAGLKAVKIEGPVTVMGEEVFAGCMALSAVALPQTVTALREGAFRWCTSLRHITLPEQITAIGNYAFYGCRTLSAVDLPDTVTEIGRYAFSGCLGLERVEFGDGLTVIGNHAFYECFALTSLSFPASVTVIQESAFSRCAAIFSVTLPPRLVTLEEKVFRECTGLASVSLPPALSTIGDAAFEKCGNLSSIALPDSTATIGASAFAGCAGLRAVAFGSAVSRIGKGAFSGCESLWKVALPASLTSLGGKAFEKCGRLSAVYYAGDAPSVGTDIYAFTPDELTSYALPGTRGWKADTSGEWKERRFLYQAPRAAAASR